MSPSRVVYVSCDPATLARDLKFFTENGYTPKEITPCDLSTTSPPMNSSPPFLLLLPLNSSPSILFKMFDKPTLPAKPLGIFCRTTIHIGHRGKKEEKKRVEEYVPKR